MADEDANTRKLFSGVPDDKRLGILRTFHHRMYDSDAYPQEEKTFLKTYLHYYCVKNKGSCLIVLIAFALIIVGILSICYGYTLPSLYTFLDKDESKAEKHHDTVEYVYYKDVFITCGIAMIGFGILCAALGFFVPLFKDSKKKKLSDEEECQRTPIIVDYELPPYDMSLQAGNYFYDDSSSEGASDVTSNGASYSSSPIENENFSTFFIQNNN